MDILREYDLVRIANLLTNDRKFDGSDKVKRAPRVGDIATIVHEYEPHDPNGKVIVEKIDDEGYTIWLADFDKDELELVSHPC
jgi:hypothetical protein